MAIQLTLYDQQRRDSPGVSNDNREYLRDRRGRFATPMQHALHNALEQAGRYRLLYEAERRKNEPTIRRLIEAERELERLRKQVQQL